MIAIGNSGKRSFSKDIIPKISDKSPLVRGAAIWAIRNLLDDSEIKEIKEKSLNKERDSLVKKEWLESIS
jgi:epoxyqueuosine reductase